MKNLPMTMYTISVGMAAMMAPAMTKFHFLIWLPQRLFLNIGSYGFYFWIR
jgi:hypothetical protein